jgi:hypothetical protein
MNQKHVSNNAQKKNSKVQKKQSHLDHKHSNLKSHPCKQGGGKLIVGLRVKKVIGARQRVQGNQEPDTKNRNSRNSVP